MNIINSLFVTVILGDEENPLSILHQQESASFIG
jgi:hypothetical protein